MILKSYYKFEKLKTTDSKLRIDCTNSTGDYAPMEHKRNKDGFLFVYIGDNTHTVAGKKRKTDLAITQKGHITSIYRPNIESPVWYGDMKGTNDAILFVVKNVSFINGGIQKGAEIEMFVANGERCSRNQLYNALCDGYLNDEINILRGKATKERVYIPNK